jgi:hypothetical protein
MATRLNDIFKVIHDHVTDFHERKMLFKTLRLMIKLRDSIMIDVTKLGKDALKERVAMFDRECARRVDDVLALCDRQTPVTPMIPRPVQAQTAPVAPPLPTMTLVVNAIGFDKIVIEFGNGRQVILSGI